MHPDVIVPNVNCVTVQKKRHASHKYQTYISPMCEPNQTKQFCEETNPLKKDQIPSWWYLQQIPIVIYLKRGDA
jgi:hypothetical protein